MNCSFVCRIGAIGLLSMLVGCANVAATTPTATATAVLATNIPTTVAITTSTASSLPTPTTVPGDSLIALEVTTTAGKVVIHAPPDVLCDFGWDLVNPDHPVASVVDYDVAYGGQNTLFVRVANVVMVYVSNPDLAKIRATNTDKRCGML